MTAQSRNIYRTLNDASEATKRLGIASYSRYKKEYRLDARLPCHPETQYPDWISWQHYFGLPERVLIYRTLEEASEAARSAGIKNGNEYRAHRQTDKRFPKNPEIAYRLNWVDWYSFLGAIRPTKYKTYAEAKSATAKLGAKTIPEYKSLHRQDPMLPAQPQEFYKTEWTDWYAFFGRASFEKYATYGEAVSAARWLGFKNYTDYVNGCKVDPFLPQNPKMFYKEDWIDYYSFLGTEPPPARYATLLEASLAAQKFSFRTSYEYFAGRGKDPRLVCKPNETYKKDWINWQHFLGVKSRKKYRTLTIASRAAQKIGFNNVEEYRLGYKQDPSLPAAPKESYPKEWKNWKDFLGINKYLTVEEASISARKLGIKSAAEYYQRYSVDNRLPALPEYHYKDHWTNWYDFLGKTNSKRKYLTFEEARNAARSIGYKSIRDYRENCKIDPRLPFSPNETYRDNWTSWSDFLGKNSPREKYKTLVEAKEAANKMGISTSSEYNIAFKADPHLPSNPGSYYVDEWIDWGDFLGKPKRLPKYESIERARRAAQLLSITNSVEYSKHYREDPRLPSRPNVQYVNEWIDWLNFLLPVDYRNLRDVKRAVKILSIKDSRGYLNKYKLYPPMPAHPERMFQQEWIDWYDLCDIPRHYDYQHAQSKVIAAGVKKQVEYRKLATSDARLPKDPAKFYKENWRNWYVFLGQDEPYNLDYIGDPYVLWKSTIAEFMKYARGGRDKVSFLCQFVRHFIEKFQLGYSPQEFLLREKVDLRLFNPILEGLKNDSRRRAMVSAVKELLDYVLRVNLSEVDEDSGELITTIYASNPFAKLNLIGGESSPKYGESVKPALAYQYVQAARLWITPVEAETFSDLHSLHVFDADWFEVEPHEIDKNDPDCVWRTIAKRTEIWFPAYWMHTLALISVPARGMQLAYNDSGEGDEWIPEFDDGGKLTWEKNKGAISKSTNNQGFIKRYAGDQPGMHFTSNKTSNNAGGYDVPWMPLELAYWMIKLRKWQQRYNPIDTPTPWADLRRTSLNETQLKNKGANCFLFRNFREVEPSYFSDRLSVRLAASLYHSQPKDLMIAELIGPEDVIRSYVSKFTPHSMRVSLLTAYTVEFGLPIEILMKIAGHSAIVMSLYYVKISSVELRQRFSEGEKRAMKDKTYAAQRMIEQGRIDEIKNDLISNTEDALVKISSDHPPASFLFRDYGICPNAGTRCADGGDVDPGNRYGNAVPHGYLGSQNCLRCRHFISGPAFVGGLLSVSNEISLQSRLQFEHFSELEEQGISLKLKIDKLEDTAYDCQQSSSEFDASELNQLRLRRRKVLSEAESAAKKLDIYLCDIQSAARLIKQCKVLINEGGRHENESSATQLILQRGHEIDFAMEETSYFRQLSEVCVNAEIYEAANSELALAPRTQMLDRMALLNDVNLHLFMLSKKQQLLVGNQLTKIMLDRLKSWERVDALIEGNLFIKDLDEGERITLQEINELIKNDPQRVEVSI